MPNVEINDLTGKSTPELTDEFEIQETGGGDSKKVNLGDIQSIIGGGSSTVGSVTVVGTSTLISGLIVQYVTTTSATVQTFPSTGGNTLINDGNGSSAGVMTLTPPSGKKIYREDGTALAADAVLYSNGDVAEFITWNIDPSGHVRLLREAGSFSETP